MKPIYVVALAVVAYYIVFRSRGPILNQSTVVTWKGIAVGEPNPSAPKP